MLAVQIALMFSQTKY